MTPGGPLREGGVARDKRDLKFEVQDSKLQTLQPSDRPPYPLSSRVSYELRFTFHEERAFGRPRDEPLMKDATNDRS